MSERGETRFAALHEGKRDNPGRRLRLFKEHREAIDEIANGRLRGAAAGISLRGEVLRFDLQVPAKKGDFVALRFEVRKARICEHEVEDRDADLDVFDLVPAAIAKVLAPELAIELPGEQVIDGAMPRQGVGARVFMRSQLIPEQRRALAPLHTGESEELTRDEVAGMRGHQVEKAGLLFGVSEGLQSREVRVVVHHRAKTRAGSSDASKMRCNFAASSRGA